MHKIRQRFSLVHHSDSTLTIETQTKQQKHTQIVYMNDNPNHTSRRRQLSKHKKKRSLGDAFFKHLPKIITNPDDNTPDEDNHNNLRHQRSKSHGHRKKRSSFSQGIGIGNKKKRNKFRKGSANFDDHNNNNNNNHDISHDNDTDNNLNGSRSHFPRAQSMSNKVAVLPEAEEDVADFGLDLEDDEYDRYEPTGHHHSHFSFSSSSPKSPQPKLRKSQSNDSISINCNVNHHSVNSGYLPPPQSPHQKHVEHEKFTLIEQMRQLQKSMTQLGEMLNDQDKNLMVEKKKNEKLTEQVNNLADENMALRQQIHRHRQDRNSVWQDLEFYKLAAQQHRDKNILLAHQLSAVTQQKADLSTYSAGLLEQLTAERKKTQRLTLKIRKYSKNVKTLHKKTHSLSGLQRYHKQYKMKQPERQRPGTAKGPDKVPFIKSSSDPISLSTPTQLEIVEDTNAAPETKRDVDNITNDHLQQKRRELQELEQQTLEILNQLQEETKQLLGETQGLSKRSEKRLRNNGATKKTKTKRKKKGGNKADDNIIITTKTETKTKTKTKTKTTIKGDKITTSKIETKKTKTKTTTQQQARKVNDNDMKEKKEDVEGEGDDDDDHHLKTGSNSSSNSNSSEDDDIDDNGDEVEFYSDEDDEGHVEEAMNKKRESIDLKDEEKEIVKEKNHRFHIQPAYEQNVDADLDIDDEEDQDEEKFVDKASTIKQHKEEVEMLKKTDAPLSLLFQAFEAQMDAEADTENDTDLESENEAQAEPVGAGDTTPTQYSHVADDSPTVFEQFANFTGFSDDEDDTTDSLQALWG